MSNKVSIQVGVDDQTQAGNASIVAGAESTKQTLEQKHQEMLSQQRAIEEKFARDNAAIFLDIQHEKFAKTAAEFEQLQQRHKAAEAKFLDSATKPLTPGQQQAAETAQAIIRDMPPPIVQRVANNQSPIVTPTVKPVAPPVEADTAGQDAAMKEALRLNAQLTKSVQELAAAERVLHQDPSTQFSESELARLRIVEKQLRDSQLAAFALAKSFREVASSVPDGSQFTQLADAIERDAIDAEGSLTSLDAKIKEIDGIKATATIEAAGVEKTLGEFRDVSEAATEAAMKARSYFEQGNQATQTAQDLQRFADVIKKSGDNSAVAQAQLSSLLAQAAQASQDADQFYALAKSEEEVARVALRAASGFSDLAKQEGIAGQAAQKLVAHNKQLAASLDASAFAQQRAEIQRASQQYEVAGQASSRGAQGMMQLAYAADDVQYGMRGIVNNIPGLLLSLGVSGGLAGAIAIAAVGVTVLTSHWKEFEQAIANPGAATNAFTTWAKGMIAEVNNFRAAANEAGVGLWNNALDSVGLLSDSQKKSHEDELLRIGQERVALDRINQTKANQAIIAKAADEQLAESAKRAGELELDRLDTIEKQDAAIAKLKAKLADIAAGPKKGFLPATPEETKRITEALADAQKKRDEGVNNERKRTEAAANESAKAQSKATALLSEHTAELTRQREIEKEINDIKSRAQQAKDDPNEAAKRKALEFARERGLDAVKEQTDATKRAADAATSADYLSAEQKKSARAAYTQAVLSQIAVEAESNQQAQRQLAAQMQTDAEQQAEFDAEVVATRERQAREAQARLTAEIEANAAAQQLTDQIHAADREAAAARLAKADADAVKANDAAIKDRDDAEDARQQRQRTLENASATKRLNDEQAIGAAKQKALLDADQLERRLNAQKEADRQAKLQQALQADPRIAAKGEVLARNVKPQDVEKAARRRAVDQAENAVRDQNEQENAKRRERGEEEQKVSPKDVQQARKGAAQEFNRKVKRGDAGAEMANERERIAKRLVDQAEQRGQLDPQEANALRAIAEKQAEDARLKAGVDDRAEKPDNDPQARAEQAKQRADRQKQENADKIAKRKADEEAKQQKAREFADVNQKAARNRKHQREEEAAREAERQRQREADNQPDPMDEVPPNPFDLFQPEPLPPVPQREPVEPEPADAEPEQPLEDTIAQVDRITQEIVEILEQRKRDNNRLSRKQQADLKELYRKRKELRQRADEPVVAEPLALPPVAPEPATQPPMIEPEPVPAATPVAPRQPEANKQQPRNGQDPSAAALKTAESAMAKMANAQAQANAEVVAALGSLTKLVTDQANRHVALHDVVAQITGHINNTSTQFAREDNSARLRAISSAGV